MNDVLGIIGLLIEGEDDRVGNEKQRTSDRTLSATIEYSIALACLTDMPAAD